MQLDSCGRGRPKEPPVEGPEGAGRKQCGCEKVAINPTDSKAPQLPNVDQPHHFGAGGASRRGQRFEAAQNAGPILEVAASQFADHEGVDQNQAVA